MSVQSIEVVEASLSLTRLKPADALAHCEEARLLTGRIQQLKSDWAQKLPAEFDGHRKSDFQSKFDAASKRADKSIKDVEECRSRANDAATATQSKAGPAAPQ